MTSNNTWTLLAPLDQNHMPDARRMRHLEEVEPGKGETIHKLFDFNEFSHLTARVIDAGNDKLLEALVSLIARWVAKFGELRRKEGAQTEQGATHIDQTIEPKVGEDPNLHGGGRAYCFSLARYVIA
ncbi:hypothetical protein Salat_1101200 [Sesamum alatum]|uniref:Uncharacterized protein n=1 Tax=Sesamum alatum TaxID=300844 RepID=A0AAE1YNR7_9LAMI|nr:hypothetical protein Salat_1101200 [Sesamum alatum]